MILDIPVKLGHLGEPETFRVDIRELSNEEAPVATRFRTQIGHLRTRWMDGVHWAALTSGEWEDGYILGTHLDTDRYPGAEAVSAAGLATYFADDAWKLDHFKIDLSDWFAKQIVIVDGITHVQVPEPHYTIPIHSMRRGRYLAISTSNTSRGRASMEPWIGYSLSDVDLALDAMSEHLGVADPVYHAAEVLIQESMATDFRTIYARQNVTAAVNSIRLRLGKIPTPAIRQWLELFKGIGEDGLPSVDSLDDMYARLDTLREYIHEPDSFEIGMLHYLRRLTNAERMEFDGRPLTGPTP